MAKIHQKPIIHTKVKKVLQKFLIKEYRRLEDDGEPLRIVDLLGTLPLAIELAGKRFKALSIVPTPTTL